MLILSAATSPQPHSYKKEDGKEKRRVCRKVPSTLGLETVENQPRVWRSGSGILEPPPHLWKCTPSQPERVSHHISLCSTFAGFDPTPFFYWCYYIPNFNFKIQWLIFYIPHGLWKSTEFGSTKCLENVSHPFSPVPLKSLLKVLPPEPIAEVRHRSLQSCRQAMEHTARRREEKHACHSTGVKSGTLFFNFSAFSYLKSQIINDDFKRYLGKLNHMYISSAK